MKRWISFVLLTAVFAAMVWSCEEDSVYHISFGETTNRVETVEGSINVASPAVFLNRPADEDLMVYLSPTGTATPGEDYTFLNPVVVRKGETWGSVELQFINDRLDEYDETGFLKLVGASTEAALDSATGKFLIRDDDGAHINIEAQWGYYTGVDLDLYLWHETSPGSGAFEIVDQSTDRSNSSSYFGMEYIQLSGLEEDGLYALSCVYRVGTSDNVLIHLFYDSMGAAILEGGADRVEFYPAYRLLNLNSGNTVIKEQFFRKKGFQFKDISPFTVPDSGS